MNSRSRRYLAGFTILLALVAAARAQEAAPTVDEIVAKHLEAIGGLEANKKLKTRETEGTITLAAAGMPWKFTSIQKAPDKKHNRIEIAGAGLLTEGCDGTTAWRKDPGQGPRQLAGEELQQKLRDARFHGMLELITEGELSFVGNEEHRERICHVLKGSYAQGAPANEGTYSIYIDEETYLLNKVEIPVRGVAAFDEVTLEMDDYRAVDGIQLPFSAIFSLGADPLLSVKVDKVTHGIPVDEALFDMPPDKRQSGGMDGGRERVFGVGAIRVDVGMNVEKFDTNGNKTVEDAEVEKGFLGIQRQMERSRDTLLGMFDKDKDGAFNQAEIEAIREFAAGLAGTLLCDKNRNWVVDESELDRVWEMLVEQAERDR